MTLDKALRNALRNTVTRCRRLLEEAVSDMLEGRLGIGRDGQVEDAGRMGHLSGFEMEHREEVISHLRHIQAGGLKPADAVAQLIREVAYTHLNRLCAYKMLERRRLIREAVGRGLDSNGFKYYLVDHLEDEKLWASGQQNVAYRHFLEWIGETLSGEVGVLFSPTDPANRLFPPQRTLDAVLDLINGEELYEVWDEEETIGWVYQYYTPKELRDQARKESQAPRNSYELAFRNQFYTPRYVVRFLVDNTLGRTWYEMRQGNTRLTERCAYLVRRPDEVFLDEAVESEVSRAQGWLRGEISAEPDVVSLGHTVNGYNRAPGPGDGVEGWIEERLSQLTTGSAHGFKTQELLDLLFLLCREDRFVEDTLEEVADEIRSLMDVVRKRVDSGRRDGLSQDARLRVPVCVPYRAPKDPRELRILDPACGSGHFLLYCFDLLEIIYEEAYDDERLGESLREEYPNREEFRWAVPALILRHNLHGIDIDVRATQIAVLALWLRAQRSYGDLGLKGKERPKITRSNIVCAESMPGEREMLEEFKESLEPTVLGQLVEVVFDKMKLAAEAGSLLKIEREIEGAIAQARAQWQHEFERATDRRGNEMLLTYSEMDRLSSHTNTKLPLFDVSHVTDEEFWIRAEGQVIDALRSYATKATNGEGYHRRLFAEDAGQGFAFIDMCRKQFDVVLMNPPFGEPSVLSFEYLKEEYQQSGDNLYGAFLIRVYSWLNKTGTYGAITDRSYLTKQSFERLRRFLVDSSKPLSYVVDLGWGVLDTANVQASAVVAAKASDPTCFLDLTDSTEHEVELLNFCRSSSKWVTEFPATFAGLPFASFAYGMPSSLRRQFRDASNKVVSRYFRAARGMAGANSDHLYRLVFEVPQQEIGQTCRWVILQKGSPYSPYYFGPEYLLLHDGGTFSSVMAYAAGRVTGIEDFGRPGLSFGKRTDYMYAFPMQEGQVFSVEGQAIFTIGGTNIWQVLAVVNSAPFQELINHICGQHKYHGYINSAYLDIEALPDCSKTAYSIWCALSGIDRYNETACHFVAPLSALPQNIHLSFTDNISSVLATREEAQVLARTLSERIDEEISSALDANYGFKGSSRLVDYVGILYGRPDSSVLEFYNLLSYALGVAFGRWDIRIAQKPFLVRSLLDPFDPLPACPPGMLVDANGFPATTSHIASEEWMRGRPDVSTLPPQGSVRSPTISDSEYPLNVDWDGILVDEPNHSDDIVRRVREVLKLLWGERVDELEGEACNLLGVKDLRTYFGNPNRFFEHHVERYSKGRRKAPIYWLLQSPKRSYGLWLYYHRLDSDILFKALHKYVEPKIRLEEGRLEEYEAHRRSAGMGGREAKQAEKVVAKQEELLTDLREFRDRLERAAKLHLRPDLNDGVVLNIAPLHDLVPWLEANNKWNELLAGKYEWSSIGKQLREKGLV